MPMDSQVKFFLFFPTKQSQTDFHGTVGVVCETTKKAGVVLLWVHK